MRAASILAGARLKVYSKLVYFTAELYNLKPIESTATATFAVDEGSRMFFNPDFAEKIGVDGAATVELHEVQHIIRDHHRRSAEVKPHVAGRYAKLAKQLRAMGISSIHQLLNYACDLEINDDILATGFAWPAGFVPLTPKLFKFPTGKTMEFYLVALLDKAETIKVDQDQDGGDQDGDADSSGGGGDAHDDGSKMPGTGGSCGSCAGNPSRAEAQATDVRKLTDIEQDILRKTVAEAIREASSGSGIGTIPGGWQVWASEQLKAPTVDWRKQLAANIRSGINVVKGAQDYAFKRPSRRTAGLTSLWGKSPILPTTIARTPRPAIAFDTSGSMGPDLLCKSLSETVGILKIVGYPCPAFAVDTIVHEVRDVCDAAAIKKMLRGGGGTDMGTAIKFAAEKKFNMVIIMTDCLTPWPRKEDMPRDLVVIVCNVSGQKQSVPAHVGRVVEVK